MASLTHRMQVLLDDERYRRLESRARARGTSIARLVREAIDERYPAADATRADAAAAFLGAPSADLPEWPELKSEMEEASISGLPVR